MPPATKRGPGRPPLTTEPLVSVTLDLTAAQAAFVRAEARAKGQSLAEFMRRLVATHQRSVEAGRARGEK